MRTVATLLVAFVFALSAPTFAQTGPTEPRITPQPSVNEAASLYFLHQVRIGAADGVMNIRYNPRRSGPVTGMLLGARVEGYYHTEQAGPDGRPARSLALLRYRGSTAVQAITADYDYAARNWIGMAHWLKSGPGEGSATQNAVGFRTVSPTPRACLRPPCTPDATLPAVPTAAAPLVTDPLAGVNAAVGNEQGPLVFRAPTEGVFEGHLWGDAISGHYASPAGTVVFIRYSSGQPLQIWRGVLAASGQSGGRGFPLSASAGGPFNWSAAAQDQIVTGLRSIYDRNSCVHFANNTSGAGGFVDVANCTDASRTAWVVFGLGSDHFAIASPTTGLFLSLTQPTGQRVQQQPCRNRTPEVFNVNRRFLDASGAVIGYEHAHNTADISAASYFTIFGNALASSIATECMGLLVSQGRVITMTCGDDKSFWTTYR
ncbi:MAG: hypothetical protein K2P58_12305 [Hyphomonadaceae bacterium]|nr:hypothetical protein [Hyphomonadaceae bacterium]